jgi:ATP phosphoribosyltransferase
MRKNLVMGPPNGSLMETTLQLLKTIGVVIKPNGRKFLAEIEGFELFSKAIFLRPQDIPEAIVDGMIDVGICGWDCVVEAGLEGRLIKVAELNYSRQSRQPVRVVVFGKSSSFVDNEDILVATEYRQLAKKIFHKATARFSHGGTEQKVAYGKYNYGVGVVETGKSLEENGLQIVKTILVSPTVIMAREDSPEIHLFGEMLQGALQAEQFCLVKMNCASQCVKNILDCVPAIDAPTISNLADGSFAIETVVPKNKLADVLSRLRLEGATGIIVQQLDVML